MPRLARSFVEMILGAVITASAFVVPAVLLSFEIADSAFEDYDISSPDDRDAAFVSDIASLFPDRDDPKQPEGDPQQQQPVETQNTEAPRRAEEKVEASTQVAAVEAVATAEAEAAPREQAASAASKARAGRESLSGGTKRAKQGQKKQKCAEPTDEIQQVDDHEYTISRDLVMEYASDLERASRLAYVAWHKDEDGDIDGFVVKKIRCGTVLEQAGLQNGDVIRAVNGKQVKSIMTAWGAWRKVKKKDVVRVTVIRKGKKIELKYRIT